MLVGVSRTSKTPLSIYLGYLGHKAANVPIVKGIEPPTALFEIDPVKVVGLTIDAERLSEIRSTRVATMGGRKKRYAACSTSTRSSSRRPRSIGGSAAPCSTSPTSRSRRRRCA